jgi:transposase InsO family protein
MLDLLVTLLRSLVSIVRTREDLMLENIALRHQLMVVQRHAKRPRITGADRALWVTLRWLWPGWHKRLVVVKPATVIAWHRAGFCTYWRWKSRNKGGRPRIDPESRELLRQMWRDNPTWGSPHIQAELAKLGIEVSDPTVRKYRPRTQKPPSQNWRTFLKNHASDIVAIDFFVVPTVTFKLLYVFVVLVHDRQRIVHFKVTASPSAQWTGQQVVEAFPYDTAPGYLLRDRDRIYGTDFARRVSSMGIEQVVTAYRSPWQNPYVERAIGSLRRECFDPVIILGEQHLRRVLREYLVYYHESRTHRGLDNDCPEPRAVEHPEMGKGVAFPVLGGLHHRYSRRAA